MEGYSIHRPIYLEVPLTDLPVVHQSSLTPMEEYEYLLQELAAIRVEASYAAREILARAKHDVGRAILDSGSYRRSNRNAAGEPSVVQHLANDLQVGVRDLYHCIRFATAAEEYGGFDGFLDHHRTDKSLSWSQIRHLLASNEPEGKDNPFNQTAGRTANRADRKKALTYARNCIGRVFTERDLEYLIAVLAIKLP